MKLPWSIGSMQGGYAHAQPLCRRCPRSRGRGTKPVAWSGVRFQVGQGYVWRAVWTVHGFAAFCCIAGPAPRAAPQRASITTKLSTSSSSCSRSGYGGRPAALRSISLIRVCQTGPVAGDDLHAGMRFQPCGHRVGLAVGQQADGAAALQINDDRAAAVALAPRPSMDGPRPASAFRTQRPWASVAAIYSACVCSLAAAGLDEIRRYAARCAEGLLFKAGLPRRRGPAPA